MFQHLPRKAPRTKSNREPGLLNRMSATTLCSMLHCIGWTAPKAHLVIVLGLIILGIAGCLPHQRAQILSVSLVKLWEEKNPTKDESAALILGRSRGYLTTPGELKVIAEKAEAGLEPYQSTVAEVLHWANREWVYQLREHETCENSDTPAWNDNTEGTAILTAKSLAYHLTGNEQYAHEVKMILQQIMTEVKTISLEDRQCQLNFGWGAPELVAAADLIEGYWQSEICTGPMSLLYSDTTFGAGNCKQLFQNWLVKNPYYVVSYAAEASKSNWGAAATNATAYIADYMADRPELLLIHRNPPQVNGGEDIARSPAEAYRHANRLALDRMNGHGIEYMSRYSCDYLSGDQQSEQWNPVKSQITERGIIPEDARRQEFCNIPTYHSEYQNYPQVHLGNNIQQCELMLRRGDRSCYDNIDHSDIPDFTFTGPDGVERTTHLRPGRGSIERAIRAIIVDSGADWRHGPALAVAYRYYHEYKTLPGFEFWFQHLGRANACSQNICFGRLTHGFAPGEEIELPPTVPPPCDRFIES